MEYQKNEDGTDKLDENGNPIPVEITDKSKEAEQLNAQLIDELKEMRLKNTLLTELLNGKKEEPPVPKPADQLTEDEKITLKVEAILAAKNTSNAQANKQAAFEKFVTDNKEFHPENDTLGLKRSALVKKFAQFNMDGLTSVDEFLSVIGDAKRLLGGNDSNPDTPSEHRIPNSPTPRPTPPGKPQDVLTDKEKKLAAQTGRTEEQLLKIKLKHPELFDNILSHVRD